jgi:hypothetical protein
MRVMHRWESSKERRTAAPRAQSKSPVSAADHRRSETAAVTLMPATRIPRCGDCGCLGSVSRLPPPRQLPDSARRRPPSAVNGRSRRPRFSRGCGRVLARRVLVGARPPNCAARTTNGRRRDPANSPSSAVPLKTRRSGRRGAVVGSERSRIASVEQQSAAVMPVGSHTCFSRAPAPHHERALPATRVSPCSPRETRLARSGGKMPAAARRSSEADAPLASWRALPWRSASSALVSRRGSPDGIRPAVARWGDGCAAVRERG